VTGKEKQQEQPARGDGMSCASPQSARLYAEAQETMK
jgi:hypothetical protein